MAISAGPPFKINPSISFIVNFHPANDKNARENLDRIWEKLSEEGNVKMAIGEYPFSKRYGWVEDKFGVSWQLFLTDPDGVKRSFIIPALMFIGDVCGKAEEASDFYMSVFKDSKRGMMARYGKEDGPDKEGTLMYSDFMISNQWFAVNDSAREHGFKFNEAISLLVDCEDQKEIDYFWKKLSFVPEAEQCGWLKDKYGVSWQIEPKIMHEMMRDKDPKKVARVTEKFMQMKKFDVEALTNAFEGKAVKKMREGE